jgi:tRNA dimethylallyltransferase
MSKSPFQSAVLIAGPTASGKSALAIQLARQRNGVIINADSMQVYRELRIISARPSADEEGIVAHRMYGHVSGADDYSVGQWLREVKLEIEACIAIGRLPIIVGGTGLYFMALQGGLAEIPPIPEVIREEWRNYAGDLHVALQKVDPVGAARLNPSDRQRIIRALEVFEATGETLSYWQGKAQEGGFLNEFNVERLFVNVPREELYGRAERRFDMMMEQGAVDEVAALPPLPAALPIMKAIGVPELLAHISGKISRDEAVTLAKTASRQYIKRQLTWWRGQMKDWTLTSNSGTNFHDNGLA